MRSLSNRREPIKNGDNTSPSTGELNKRNKVNRNGRLLLTAPTSTNLSMRSG